MDSHKREATTGDIPYKAVVSREEALRQLRSGSIEIVDLCPDPVLVPTSYTIEDIYDATSNTASTKLGSTVCHPLSPETVSTYKRPRVKEIQDEEYQSQPSKRRKITSNNDGLISTVQTEVPWSTPTTSTTSALQKPPGRPKKSLWRSDNAEANMSKSSGLPSPESIPEEPLKERGPMSYLCPSWSFEEFEDPATTLNSSHSPDELIVDTLPDEVRKKRDTLSRQGIEVSQRLRGEKEYCKQRSSATGNVVDKHDCMNIARKFAEQINSNPTSIQVDKTCNQLSDHLEEDPVEIERLLDIAEGYGRSRDISSVGSCHPDRASHASSSSAAQLNPLSRDAAEKWRTQDRHLNLPQQPQQSHGLTPTTACEPQSPSAQDKEERMARVLQNSRWSNLARLNREAEKRLLNMKFHGVDLNDNSKGVKTMSKSKVRPRPVAEVQKDLHKLMGTSTRSQNLGRGDAAGKAAANELDFGSDGIPRQSLSRLQQLGSHTNKAENAFKSIGATPQEVFDNLPVYSDTEQVNIRHDRRPNMFTTFTKKEQDLFVERALKRERERDLETIRSTFAVAAELGSLVPFDPSDPKTERQLSDIRRFAEAVLNREKSGQLLREKIRSIRDSFKKRLEITGQQPDKGAADSYLSVLLQPKLFDKLISKTTEVAGRISYLSGECHRINNFYHQKRRCPRGKKVGIKSSSPAKLLSAKQRLSKLHQTLSLFDKASDGSEDEPEVIDLGPSRDDDDDGMTSEEDEAEDIMLAAGLQKRPSTTTAQEEGPVNQDSNNQKQNQQKQVPIEPTVQPKTFQGVDQRLLNEMRGKRQQQSHLSDQNVQKPDPQIVQNSRQRKFGPAMSSEKSVQKLSESAEHEEFQDIADYSIEEDLDHYFDDADINGEDGNATDSDDNDEKPQCHQYIVKGACQGLSSRLDSSDYILGRYLNKKDAKEHALSFAAWVKEQIPMSGEDIDVNNFRESSKETKTSFEQNMAFGDDERVSCRSWIEQEVFSPDEGLYEKAKVRRACQGPEIWFVDWERTITPYDEQDEDEDSEDQEQGVEQKSTSDNDHSSLMELEGTVEEATIEVRIPNETQTEDQDEATNRTLRQPSSATSPAGSNTNSQSEPFASTSMTLTTQADKDTEDVDISYDNDSSQPGAPAIEDQNGDEYDLFGPDTPEPISIPTTVTSHSPTELSSSQRSLTPPTSVSEPPHKPFTTETLVTRATGDHLRFFTTIAHANRHAKDVFMRWYIDRLPGLANHGFIEHEDEAMEEELRAIGNQSCWSRVEDFIQERDGDVPGERVKVTDQLRVWVRKGKSFGPSN